MVTRVDRYVRLALLAYKVFEKLYRLYTAFTPQEREAIGYHLQAIYLVLRNVASRRKDAPDLPAMLMLPPQTTERIAQGTRRQHKKRFHEHSRHFRQNTRRVARTIRAYQSSFTVEDAKEIGTHLNDVRKILAEVERRSRK